MGRLRESAKQRECNKSERLAKLKHASYAHQNLALRGLPIRCQSFGLTNSVTISETYTHFANRGNYIHTRPAGHIHSRFMTLLAKIFRRHVHTS